MNSESRELVKRLRMDAPPTEGDMEEAADRIEALERECAELEAREVNAQAAAKREQSRAEAAEAKCERLRVALENLTIAIGMGWDLEGVLDVASAALKENTNG